MPLIAQHFGMLYHFTDRSNLPSIRNSGGLWSWADIQKHKVECLCPGGNTWSHDSDKNIGLDSYVHLCFRPEHPMQYTKTQTGQIPNPVYLKILPTVLNLEGTLFTDDVSNKAGVKTLIRAEANQLFDFEMFRGPTRFYDLEYRARYNRTKKYEALIPHFIPKHFIVNLHEV